MRRRDFLKAGLLATAATVLPQAGCIRLTESRPNIVFILTDDQRWDTLWAMPIVQEKLINNGVTFTNAFVTTPACSPSRASILSGGFYPRDTGVLSNDALNGGMSHFRDNATLATALSQNGYQTGFVGKYMHGYYPGYVPPGWTRFVANNDGGMLRDWFNLSDITVGGSNPTKSGTIITSIRQYLTDFQRDQAIEFLDRYGKQPFFLWVSIYAPHVPSTPAPGDENLFPDDSYRSRAFIEKDLADKPAWVQRAAQERFRQNDRGNRDRKYFQSLAAVDRAVRTIVEKLIELGVAEQTMIIFSSDNGLLRGEHHIGDKGSAYEEALRVPLVVAMPGIQPRTDDHLVAINLDIPATILDLTRVDGATDGLSLRSLIEGKHSQWREEILIEDYGYLKWWRTQGFDAPGLGIWGGLRTKSPEGEWKYVEHPTGERELYDLRTDPFEEENKAGDPAFQQVMKTLADHLAQEKGLVITTEFIPCGRTGEDFFYELRAWGGKQPYQWRVVRGELPQGLSLDSNSGVIRGVPTQAGEYNVLIQVIDSSVTRHSGKPQAFVTELCCSVT